MLRGLFLGLALCAAGAAQQADVAPEKLAGAGPGLGEPAIAALPGGALAVAWIGAGERSSRLLLRTRGSEGWSRAEEIIRQGDIFHCAAAAGAEDLWVFWSERQNDRWQIWGRQKRGAAWRLPERLAAEGSNPFVRAASSPDGQIFLVWQSFRGGQSDIYLRVFRAGSWSDEMRVSESPANDWEPAVAAGADGSAYIAWDSYDKGDYDIAFRAYENGKLTPLELITSSPRYQAHAAVAVDGRGRPWVAWDESGVNWGKDYGRVIAAPLATPLDGERSIRVAAWDGTAWLEPRRRPGDAFPPELRQSSERPQIVFDSAGVLTMVFRRKAGAARENEIARFDGAAWSDPQALPSGAGSVEQEPAITGDPAGVWSAWAGDSGVYCARLVGGGKSAWSLTTFQLFAEPFAEAIPVHSNEAADVQAIRRYKIGANGKQYRIFRGDLDLRSGGPALDLYRYALDAAALDFVAAPGAPQQLADVFSLPGAFTAFYASERDAPFPKGARTAILAARGARTPALSIPVALTSGRGLDWHDFNADAEPVAEVYEGAGESYEYAGAPKMTVGPGRHPEGFWWNALAKGYKLGVVAGSGEGSTHIAYTCVLAENLTREALLDGLRKRHSYAATDNILLDFRAGSDPATYLMGDSFHADTAPRLSVSVAGTGTIKQIDIVKNQKFVHTVRPAAKSAAFDYTDPDFGAGDNYYYVRVIQEDGQMAWSSPIWVKSDPKPPVVR